MAIHVCHRWHALPKYGAEHRLRKLRTAAILKIGWQRRRILQRWADSAPKEDKYNNQVVFLSLSPPCVTVSREILHIVNFTTRKPLKIDGILTVARFLPLC